MKEINFEIIDYYYLINIEYDSKADFDTLDIIGHINLDIFNDLENLIGYKENYF
jgi:methionyl-tRNA synthetase